MKIFGVVPARMAASRFPGKPLHKILGMPMIEHVYKRANLYPNWNGLVVATCDKEIEEFVNGKKIPVIMTGSHHSRALDRVAEAVKLMDCSVDDDDIIVCVQGDEPMLQPDMIDAVISPLIEDKRKAGVILSMHIIEESIWLNPDTVKIIYNSKNEVLYTSRAPVPYSKGTFSPELMARRIYGIFSFRWKYLKAFSDYEETRLETLEACDSNRILDMEFRQHIAPYPFLPSYSVDSPSDIKLVEAHMKNDGLWGIYKNEI